MVLSIAGGSSYFFCRLCTFSAAANAAIKFVICCIVPNTVFGLFFMKTPEFSYLKGKVSTIIKTKLGKGK